ncbi:MAG: ABC transporter permease [Phycisphaerales bacterium]|nr:ABC transporter permease [Phycisphaerales bacterium]
MSTKDQKGPETISGIDVMRGVGVERARPFWADAWHRVVIRRGAQFGLVWIGIIGFFAIFAPVIANGLPLISREIGPDGSVVSSYSPLWLSLTATDILLLLGGVLGPILFLIPMGVTRQLKLGWICSAALLCGLIVVLIATLRYALVGGDVTIWAQSVWFKWTICLGSALTIALLFFWLPTFKSMLPRIAFAILISLLAGLISADRWSEPVLTPERFIRGQEEGKLQNTYTIIPWSPTQSRAVFYSRKPVRTAADAYRTQAENRIDDGVAYYARAVIFNLKSVEGELPLRNKTVLVQEDGKPVLVQQILVDFLTRGSTEGLKKTEIELLLDEADTDYISVMAEAGVSKDYLSTFEQLAKDMKAYSQAMYDTNVEAGNAAAVRCIEIVADLEPANRNSRITIADAGEELIKSIDQRVEYVVKANQVAETSYGSRDFILGTDPIGRDVMSQMLHACRLSISIGLVSTGLSVLIGIIVGSLMGYFGGWVDLVLSRIVEIFMAIPVLFLLIVAASVLPRNTYVMMVIIGCVTWTGSARFIRAEFLKLRNQDFVQSCRAVGLPLHSTLFRHMLPNGVTPVLVQASFGVAAAIIAEATLSYLGLGPYGQSSWGKLLALTTGETGVFLWWMAVFPGAAIFLTVLAYNVLGENFRDAIDPKMRKAAH